MSDFQLPLSLWGPGFEPRQRRPTKTCLFSFLAVVNAVSWKSEDWARRGQFDLTLWFVYVTPLPLFPLTLEI